MLSNIKPICNVNELKGELSRFWDITCFSNILVFPDLLEEEAGNEARCFEAWEFSYFVFEFV